jgi:hypothetical protein
MKLSEKILYLQQERGVLVPSPESLEIGDDVDLDNIHGPDTILHAGTRLRGRNLLILPGCQIGREGPTTIEDCALARGVELKAGYFAGSVFLERASMGLGAHVRAGCLLEEQANGAHTVGLKQTILLPFVTLGSLINFCDILMAGGTSRRDHSEVGSSFIHFNFTPFGRHGDKATPSLVGDVPSGVMLRQPRIFLGGQAGLVGPVQIGYGTVLAAGFVYRRDYGPDKLVVGERIVTSTRDFTPARYARVCTKVCKNLEFIGNLAALWHWYERVRIPHGSRGDALQQRVYRAAQRAIEGHFADRIKQLDRFAGDVAASLEEGASHRSETASANLEEQQAFCQHWPQIRSNLSGCEQLDDGSSPDLQQLCETLSRSRAEDYVALIRELDGSSVEAGMRWLAQIVTRVRGLWPERSALPPL